MEFKDCHRVATPVLVDRQNNLLGALPPIELSTPWYQEIGELVELASLHHDVDITILRLLTTDENQPPQIAVSYVAEAASPIPNNLSLQPWVGNLDEHPLRLPYAHPGGPGREIEWAAQALASRNLGQIARKTQIRTWNLSSIWKLETDSDTFWLKSVPPFFSHEGATINLLGGECVPDIVAFDEKRTLLADVHGEDCHNANLQQILHMVDCLVDLQWRWHTRVDDLLGAGIPDWRGTALPNAITSTIERNLATCDASDRTKLRAFARDLPEILSRIERCGIPATLVHGDYHPGNWRGLGNDLVILDWGDCFVGNPLLDISGLVDRVEEHADEISAHWQACWENHLPHADVKEAMRLCAPVARARMAAIYQAFLDSIEPSEHIYHEDDPVSCLHQVATMTAAEPLLR